MDARPLWPLLLLFVGSGCAALIYEVVWFQFLQLVIGVSALSLGVLLGTFMGGMCVGSLVFSRVISARHHPLRVYAVLELGIGGIGIAVLFGMPVLAGAYTQWAGPGPAGLALRGLVAAACLLPPTVLMGATLPAMSRWVETTPQGVSWLGFFYGGNIGGAVAGSLLAGFYLLRVHDAAVATCVAAALNLAVALIGFGFAGVAPYAPPDAASGKAERAAGSTAVYVAIALSGMTALAAEVIWTRLLSLMFGGTVYTFSLIVAAFLFGLGLGSSGGSALARRMGRPRLALGWCQMLLCGAIAWTAYVLMSPTAYWPIGPSFSIGAWGSFGVDLVRCLWAVLPGAILWGASFPLALASVARRGQDPARLVGGVYAANTVGAIAGALAASLMLVAWVGTQHAQQFLIVVSALSGLLVLAPVSFGASSRARQIAAILPLALATGGAAVLAGTVRAVPGMLVAYGKYAATKADEGQIIYVGEGPNASVAVSRLSNGVLNYHNAGKVQASSEPQDMRLQRMLGHLTTLLPAHPRSVLVIGCGAGVTAGAVSIDPAVERVTIAEIEPLVPQVASTYFSAYNHDVVRNPKVQFHIDDARHFLLTSGEKFDAIPSDPLDPWVKGAAMLYTSEFFDTVKRHLNPGGVVTVFVQLYWSNEDAVKSELATFFRVFPHGTVWGNTSNGAGYDLVLVGQVEPASIDVDAMEQRLRRPEYAAVAQSLGEVGFDSAVLLFSTYAGQASDLSGWLKDAAINRDRNLRLGYLAGLAVNFNSGAAIYSDMLAHSPIPEQVFTGPAVGRQALFDAIRRARGVSD
jgi:spermidine synthase